MPIQRDQDKRHFRYHEVDSPETRAAVRRNFYLMLAAAVGIALSFGLTRMCSGQESSTFEMQSENLRRNLEAALPDYVYDVKTTSAEDDLIRCTVFVIASQDTESPEAFVDEFESAASGVFGDFMGEIVWRFYRKTPSTAGGDPAFIGLHRTEIADLEQKLDPDGENN